MKTDAAINYEMLKLIFSDLDEDEITRELDHITELLYKQMPEYHDPDWWCI